MGNIPNKHEIKPGDKTVKVLFYEYNQESGKEVSYRYNELPRIICASPNP
jgi:hypothetical protein